MVRQNLDLGFLGESHVLAPLARRAQAAPSTAIVPKGIAYAENV